MQSKRDMSKKPGSAIAVLGPDPASVGEVHVPVPVTGKRAVNPELRNQMIAHAAYYRAERRGFCGGSELEDWLEAEAEIDRTLSADAFRHD